MLLLSFLIIAEGGYVLSTSARPLKQNTTPAIARDFPDPSIIQYGGSWYAYGTSSNGVNVQIASSRDFVSWAFLDGVNALPILPPWVNEQKPDVWAPSIIQTVCALNVCYYNAAFQY
jgi:beta-xylosidase